MTNTTKSSARTFRLRKRIDQWRYLELVFHVGANGVTFDDNAGAPFRITLTDARKRWTSYLAAGYAPANA